MDLPAIIQSAIEALIAESMQGITDATTAAVEARSAADDRGRGLSSIMQAHLYHICGVVGDEEPPSIWRVMELSQTKAEGLALLSQFFLTGMSACRSEFHSHADFIHPSPPSLTLSQGGPLLIMLITRPVRWEASMHVTLFKAWEIGVQKLHRTSRKLGPSTLALPTRTAWPEGKRLHYWSLLARTTCAASWGIFVTF